MSSMQKSFFKSQLSQPLFPLGTRSMFDVPSVTSHLPFPLLWAIHAYCCLQDESHSSAKHILQLWKMNKSDTSMLAA